MRSILKVTILFTFLFAVFFYYIFFTQINQQFTSANEAGVYSQENSYMFLSPLRARANGEEKIRLTIFILNQRGLGVSGRSVSIQEAENLEIEVIQGLTDSFGKAVFDISSTEQGEYFVDIMIDSTVFVRRPQLSFD